MFMILKRKQMIITALVLMLGIAGYLNYRYDADSPKKTASLETGDISEPETGETVMVSTPAKEKIKISKDDTFLEERLKLDAAREKTREELNGILNDETVSNEIKEETQRKLADLAKFEENEVMAQNLLGAKGFKTTMVYITHDGVTVTVKQDALSRSDTAKIVDVIFELTKNNNIKIVEVE